MCWTSQNWLYTLRPRQNGHSFAYDIFKCIFLNENVWISIKISLKFVPKGPINNIPALVQIMAWRLPGDKPSSEPMVVSYWHIYASLGLNEFRCIHALLVATSLHNKMCVISHKKRQLFWHFKKKQATVAMPYFWKGIIIWWQCNNNQDDKRCFQGVQITSVDKIIDIISRGMALQHFTLDM